MGNEPVDGDTLDVQKIARMRRGDLLPNGRRIRHRSALELWAWEPVMIIRLLLVAAWLIAIDFAIWSVIAGIPVFEVIVPRDGPFGWFQPAWSVALIAAAVVAGLASIAERFEKVERWAALAVLALNATYVVALHAQGFVSHDPARQAAAAYSLYGLVLPAGRFLWLASHAGRRVVRVDTAGHPISGVPEDAEQVHR